EFTAEAGDSAGPAGSSDALKLIYFRSPKDQLIPCGHYDPERLQLQSETSLTQLNTEVFGYARVDRQKETAIGVSVAPCRFIRQKR
ncbi:unnamed protein product, partial [Amoebophrya sp. A120]